MIAGAIALVPLNHRTRSPNTFQHQVLMKRVVVPSYHFDPFSRSYCSRSSAQNSLSHACSMYYWAEQSWGGFAWGGRKGHSHELLPQQQCNNPGKGGEQGQGIGAWVHLFTGIARWRGHAWGFCWDCQRGERASDT